MMAVTLAIVSEAMFGTDVRGEARDVGGAVDVAMHVTMRRVARAFNLPPRWPTPENMRFARAIAALDGIVARMIAARRRDDSRHDDLLAMLVALTDADTGERMSDAQLRDEVMTVFLAGHETTASALTFTCYLLARHPEIAARVHDEVRRVVGDRPPTADDAKELTYTTMAVRESMRLYPPGWLFARSLIGDDTVGNWALPAGSWVMISSYVTHRRPDFWDEADAFRPERFEPAQVERRHKFAYFPFGGGPRLCIGQPMALLELQLLIAMVTQRFHLEVAPGEDLRLDPLVTLRPRGGLRMQARPRG
jgi:cytochrome P450